MSLPWARLVLWWLPKNAAIKSSIETFCHFSTADYGLFIGEDFVGGAIRNVLFLLMFHSKTYLPLVLIRQNSSTGKFTDKLGCLKMHSLVSLLWFVVINHSERASLTQKTSSVEQAVLWCSKMPKCLGKKIGEFLYKLSLIENFVVHLFVRSLFRHFLFISVRGLGNCLLVTRLTKRYN